MPERRAMRRSLLVSTLENLARNLRDTSRLTTFEVGRVYLPEAGNGVLPAEDRRICLAMTGPRRPLTFHGDPGAAEEMDFFDLKGVVELLLYRLGYDAKRTEYRARPDTGVFGPRCAEVLVMGRRSACLAKSTRKSAPPLNWPPTV